MMNKRAEELGMADTHFVNCTGLDDEPEAATHKTSAADIATMSRELLTKHSDIKNYTTIWMDTVRNGTFGLSNTNKLVRFYSGATGLKTGFTSSAGYCLSASALRDGMELIAVVMGSETSQARFAACKSLLDYGFANYALVSPEAESGQVQVKLGIEDTVRAVPAQNPQLLIDKAQRDSIHTTLDLKEQIEAPVSQGQRLGTLTVKAGEQVLQQIPLVAEISVPKLRFPQLYVRVFKQLCMAK